MRWCDHIKPATALVACSGTEHRVSWRKGKVVLEDHDVGAERAMLAFGGELPECLKVLQLWRNLHSWAMSIELFRQVQSSLGPAALLAPGDLAARNQLGLMLTWDRAWKRGAYLSEHGRLLHDHIRPDVLALLREHLKFWMAKNGCRRISAAALEVPPKAVKASLHGEMDTVGVRATVSLTATWVVQVWGRGLALVDGALVLEVLGHAEHGAAVLVQAARWDEAEAGMFRPRAAPARVRRDPAGAWRLTWDPPENRTW